MNEYSSYGACNAAFVLDTLCTLWLMIIFNHIGDKTEQPRHILAVQNLIELVFNLDEDKTMFMFNK